MTRMIDTNGKEHTIHAAGNVATLQSIGWTVKDGTAVKDETADTTPATEQEWDTVFGMRR